MTIGAAIFVLFVLFLLYFLPLIVAVERGHHQAGMVCVINIFLGWTLVGWVVALAIACSAKRAEPIATPPARGPSVAERMAAKPAHRSGHCPRCGQPLTLVDRFCTFCNLPV